MSAILPRRVARSPAHALLVAGFALSAVGCDHVVSMLLDAGCDSEVAKGNAAAKEFADADFGGVDYVASDHASTSTLSCPEQAQLGIHFKNSAGMQDNFQASAERTASTDASTHLTCRRQNGRFEIAADERTIGAADRAAARAAFDDACAHYQRAR